MKKSDFVAAVAEKSGISRQDAERAVNAAVDIIRAEVCSGGRVQLPNFGIFEAAQRAGRKGRSLSTHEPLDIPATRVPRFKPSESFREAVKR